MAAHSIQVTTMQQRIDAKAWQTQDINNDNDQQKKYPLERDRKKYWTAETSFTTRQPHP